MAEIRFDGPGKYFIRTKEILGNNVIEFFRHSRIDADKNGDGKPCNHVFFKVKDQAELTGFINMLYSYRYTILKIERLAEESGNVI